LEQVNLSKAHDPEWALFLPAVSSFYIAGLGKQRSGEQYFDANRIPQSFNGDVEKLNFLNEKEGLYTYKWGLYSAGHANLDVTVTDPAESIIRDRDRQNTFLLGDSGGFQILKCQWPADWKDPNCPRAMKKRKEVLTWMDTYMDYGMCLDIPSQSLTTYHIKDPKTGKSAHGISTIEEAISATHINNEYFIKHRNGNCKFLNVLQGRNHDQSDSWYDEMKKYCDPNIYPETHFNGWAFGGQNKIDMHLMLRRLVNIIHDGLLQPGKHDLIHCLGVSILEYAVLFSDIQRAIRKYHNPNLRITYDCASPFFSAAKGLIYFNNSFEHRKKWSYSMEKTAESKNYGVSANGAPGGDQRKFSDACLQDGVHKIFTDSPVTDMLKMKDVCYRGQGFINQQGKETKTSWDTLSYTLVQSHNVYQHIVAVQEANRKYEQGVRPKMVMHKLDDCHFGDIIDEIFSLNDRQRSLDLIDSHSSLWMQMQSGSQGISGKKTINVMTTWDKLFVEKDTYEDSSPEEELEDSDDAMKDVLGE
jgi:hypothetical protein